MNASHSNLLVLVLALARSLRLIVLWMVAVGIAGSSGKAECVFPLPGLVSWWRGEGNAEDTVGGYPGALGTNGASFSTGYVGRAFSFDGNNGFVQTTLDVQPIAMPSTSWEAWIYPTRLMGSARQVILSDDDGRFDRTVGIEGNSTNFGIFRGQGSGSSVWQPAGVGASLEEWQHIVVIYSPTNIIFYKNAVRYAFTIPARDGQATLKSLYLGNLPGGGAAFQGLLDEVRVYNRALSPVEVTALYAAGTNGMCRPSEPVGVIHTNDFDNEIIDQLKWSDTDTDTPPRGHRRFFGPYATNQTLTLSNLPLHTNLTLVCDLFVIGSWDGLASPHLMDISVAGGPTLLHSSFHNSGLGGPQSYPSPHRTNDFPGRAGALEIDTLGYDADSVYRLRFNFPHTNNQIVFRFAASNLVAGQGEFWGLDNLKVYAGGPSVLLTEPTNHTALFAPTSVVLRATAAASTGALHYVQFFANHALLGTISNAPYEMTWSNVPGGFYVLAARATDEAGRTSESLATFQVGGLLGEYFSNPNLTGSPATNIDAAVNFNWGSRTPAGGLPADAFSVRWSGDFVPKNSGHHSFQAAANDGFRLWIDGYRWIDNWQARANNLAVTNTVLVPNLVATQHYRIQMESFESNNFASASLRVQGPNEPMQTISANRLVPPVPNLNRPPNTPVIKVPQTNSPLGDAVHPMNFQMAVDFFSDPDTGQSHRESEWELLLTNSNQVVWQSTGTVSSGLLSNSLANGVFVNSHAGRPGLLPESGYFLRVRHRDNSQAANDWGAKTQVVFNTSPPFISPQPYIVSSYQTNLLLAGETVVLEVKATNVSPWVHFQWLHNGLPIPGAITNTLTLYDITPAEAGGYSVIVSNPAGSRTNSPLPVLVDASFLARAETRFDTDNEGWTTLGNAPSTNLTFFFPGGNPGGYIYAADPAGGVQLYWIAPSNYLGNKSSCHAGYLSFDLRLNETRNPQSTNDVVLEGGGLSLVFDTPFNPALGWTFYRIPLVENAGWHKNSLNGPPATQAELLQVLADLRSLRIRAGFSTRAETDYLDNVRLLGPACADAVILVARSTRDSSLQLEWPANACLFSLESAPTLRQSNWLPEMSQPVLTNSLNQLTIPASSPGRFYRLRKP